MFLIGSDDLIYLTADGHFRHIDYSDGVPRSGYDDGVDPYGRPNINININTNSNANLTLNPEYNNNHQFEYDGGRDGVGWRDDRDEDDALASPYTAGYHDRWRREVKYAYDAAAERAKERMRLGLVT